MMDGATMVADTPARPLPGLQRVMAQLVADGRVAYAPSRAQWFEGPGEADAAVRARGRTLRELRAAGLLAVLEEAGPDERGAYRVELTEVGRARLRPPVEPSGT